MCVSVCVCPGVEKQEIVAAEPSVVGEHTDSGDLHRRVQGRVQGRVRGRLRVGLDVGQRQWAGVVRWHGGHFSRPAVTATAFTSSWYHIASTQAVPTCEMKQK